MLWTLLPYVVVLVAGFVVGLLVGRKYPAVADQVAVVANEAKDAASKATATATAAK